MGYDYSGKEVYVGIDVHKKSYSVCCVSEGLKIKSWTMESSPELLLSQLHKYFEDATIYSCYEAGFSGYTLHRLLVNGGINNIVVNPGSIETASRDRVKTDKRDAKKLAEQLYFKKLSCIYIPGEKEQLSRVLTRHRATLVDDRKRCACRIKSKLFEFGYDSLFLEGQTTNAKWVNFLLTEVTFAEELKYVLEYFCKRWLELTEEIKEVDKKIAFESRNNPELANLERIYKSVPGLGDVSARELSRELGNLSQFTSNKKAYSFLGLTPSESSSGEKRRQGSISKCGRPRLRHLLIEIAWRYVAGEPAIAEKFVYLSHKRGKKRAIVAIARILVGRLRTCLMSSLNYQLQGA